MYPTSQLPFIFRFFHTMQKSFLRAHSRLKLYFITTMLNIGAKFSKFTLLFSFAWCRPTLLENSTICSVPLKRTFRWSFFLSPSMHSSPLRCNTFDFIYYLSFCLLFAINHTIYEILLCLWGVRKYFISFHWIDCRNPKSLKVKTGNSACDDTMHCRTNKYYAINNECSWISGD